MNITINGKAADITLEQEKTIGDILGCLENWLENSGHFLSGMDIDNETILSGAIEPAFDREIAGIKNLEIRTSSLAELGAEALLKTASAIEAYENADFDEKSNFVECWDQSPEAGFLAVHSNELWQWAKDTFSGAGISPAELRGIIDERIRELADPFGELDRTEPLIETIVQRLTDLPLDLQTGKDLRAAETISIFSAISGKIFRVFNILKTPGFIPEELTADNIPISDYVNEFSDVLKEFLVSYESKDSVLTGDLAEYELAPRLRSLYNAIRIPVQEKL
jgi:hypothetical protein